MIYYAYQCPVCNIEVICKRGWSTKENVQDEHVSEQIQKEDKVLYGSLQGKSLTRRPLIGRPKNGDKNSVRADFKESKQLKKNSACSLQFECLDSVRGTSGTVKKKGDKRHSGRIELVLRFKGSVQGHIGVINVLQKGNDPNKRV